MNKKVIWALLAFCAASFIGQLIIYPRLPEQVPVHWNANNEIDGWAGKGAALLMGLLPLLMLLLFIVIPKIDPKRENYEKHAGVYQMFAVLMTVFMGGVSWMVPLGGLGIEIPVGLMLNLLLGLIFVLLGNQMPRIRFNYTFGIRTPWTLASESVWKKTHRVCGFVFVLSGLVMMVCGFFTGWAATIGVILLLVGCAAGSVYSWWLFEKEQKG